MKNMYEILDRMNLLEGKGSKPDFLDLDKDGNKKEPMKKAAKEVDESTGDYSAKKAAAGKDIGKPGKAFATIAAKAGKAYGSKERGEKVAGAVLKKLRAKEDVAQEGNKFTGNLAKARAAGLKKADLDGDGDMETVREQQVDELDMKLLKGLQGAMSKNQKDPESERNIHKKYGYRSDRDDTGNDDDYDEHGNLKDKKKAKHKDDGPKKKGRPAGTGRKIGAKGPTGKSKLLKKGSIKESMTGQAQQIYNELADIRAVAKQVQTGQGQFPQGFASRLENSIWAAMSLIQSQQPAGAQVREGDEGMISLVDKGEYDREGDMAREQLHTAAEAAKELHDILDADENLPEWVQSKITKALDYLDTARDYMKASDAEDGEEMPVSEKAVSKAQQKFMGMAHAMQKGEKIKGASPELKKVAKTMKKGDVEDFAKTKHKGLPEKKKKEEEVEETTVAGAVATAPAGGKGKKGMVFGKGVYEGQIAESFEKKLNMITEGMSINMSVGEDGQKSLSVNATDEDAEQLAAILKMAGLGSQQSSGCGCGTTPCSCEQMDEDYANSPDEETETTDYMTKTIAGGLNKPKRDVAGNGQSTVPVTAVRVQEDAELEQNLFNLYKQYKTK